MKPLVSIVVVALVVLLLVGVSFSAYRSTTAGKNPSAKPHPETSVFTLKVAEGTATSHGALVSTLHKVVYDTPLYFWVGNGTGGTTVTLYSAYASTLYGATAMAATIALNVSGIGHVMYLFQTGAFSSRAYYIDARTTTGSRSTAVDFNMVQNTSLTLAESQTMTLTACPTGCASANSTTTVIAPAGTSITYFIAHGTIGDTVNLAYDTVTPDASYKPIASGTLFMGSDTYGDYSVAFSIPWNGSSYFQAFSMADTNHVSNYVTLISSMTLSLSACPSGCASSSATSTSLTAVYPNTLDMWLQTSPAIDTNSTAFDAINIYYNTTDADCIAPPKLFSLVATTGNLTHDAFNASDVAFGAGTYDICAVDLDKMTVSNVIVLVDVTNFTGNGSYSITFEPKNAALGAKCYNVTFDSVRKRACGASSVVFAGVGNGSYDFSVSPPAHFTATPYFGTFVVDGYNTTLQLLFVASGSAGESYVTFSATCASGHTVGHYNVTFDGYHADYADCAVNATFGPVGNGTYLWNATGSANVICTDGYVIAPTGGNVTVRGANVTVALYLNDTGTVVGTGCGGGGGGGFGGISTLDWELIVGAIAVIVALALVYYAFLGPRRPFVV